MKIYDASLAGTVTTVSGSTSNLTGSFSGSFSGSHIGNGYGLFNIPASGVTGLELNKIVDGGINATISATQGLRVNTDTIITGSLTVTGNLTAQQFILSSSVTYLTESFASGSHKFGDSSDDNHNFTGSVVMTGSLTVVTNGNEFQVNAGGVNIGNALTDNHIISGSVRINPNGLFVSSSGDVGIGTITPSAKLNLYNVTTATQLIITGGDTSNQRLEVTDGTVTNRFGIFGRTNGDCGTIGTQTNHSLALNTNNTERMRITATGNVGIGTTSPVANDGDSKTFQLGNRLVVQNVVGSQFLIGTNAYYDGTWKYIAAAKYQAVRGTGESGFISFHLASAGTAGGTITNMDGSDIKMIIKESGNVGIGLTDPLGKLSTFGGAVQFMGDYQNHQTIIKSAGATGTFNGELTITIPQMSNASSDGYGGYSCEVYVAAYPGHYCHAWFSGYNNGGITPLEATVLRSSGGFSISQTSTGANNQGFIFVINYPNTFVHPAARIIFNKGGSITSTAHPANSITAVFS
jgi:hypothetical protein